MKSRDSLAPKPIQHDDLMCLLTIHLAAFSSSALPRLGAEAVRR